MIIKLIHIFTFLLTLQCTYADSAWAKLDHFKTQSKLIASFKIVNYDSDHQIYDQQTGRFFYHPQYGSKWVAEDPYKQTTWINKKSVTIYDVPLNQVTIKRFTAVDYDLIASLLSSDMKEIKKNYTTVSSSAKEIHLKPKSTTSTMNEIIINFNNQSIPIKVQVIDNIGYSFKMTLKPTGKEPIQSDFEIRYPKNVEIIQ
ncbi:MAG: hypothetical protein CMF42_02265 [Legionellales bacterium]|nr:hypothetical protein [Legionellales bacterium]|tara:strand:- start:867 stop:1466 length:600 start_codon:yes stop_codon:yes gene_type:complete